MTEYKPVEKLATKTVIIGLGWLGLPLANTLISKEHRVFGTVTSKEKKLQLSSATLGVECFSIYTSEIDSNRAQVKSQHTANMVSHTPLLFKAFNNASVVINIPPGRRNFEPQTYIKRMCALINMAFEAGAKNLIFISTTSVYGNQNGTVTNDSPRMPITASALAHVEIEDFLQNKFQHKSYVLRPAGLVGTDVNGKLRHPVFSLSHKKDITLGNDPVNLVHQKDVINVIVKIIERNQAQPLSRRAFNVCALEHPSRSKYYPWCAQQLNIPIPHFTLDTKKRQLGKLIDARDTFKALNITPAYPNPKMMLGIEY